MHTSIDIHCINQNDNSVSGIAYFLDVPIHVEVKVLPPVDQTRVISCAIRVNEENRDVRLSYFVTCANAIEALVLMKSMI